ncbi:terpene synthase family protein [Wenjunlia tyrosinilytica]|uniref:Terpene synthase n=1 Tax=Wenjunlia tyrosinilytica TaxID=1544741 RepID=A0A918E1K3_9ACTN|nr:hypothetical protein [Wenjunlia tyrosinilytica]GGP01073.1 hypothetical protein GCM10012280_71190 [Wenjunlia tyrosinilytica]
MIQSQLGVDESNAGLVPPLYCPIPSVLHPLHQSVADHTLRWAEKMGLMAEPETARKIQAMRAHEFVCRIASDAQGQDGLDLMSQWLCSMLAIDDEWDAGRLSRDPASTLLKVIKLLATINVPQALTDDDDIYLAIVRDVFIRAREWAPAEAVKRWADSQLESFMGAATFVALRAADRPMSFDEYLLVGTLDRGTRACIDLIAVVERTCVPQSELSAPRVLALTQAAKFLVLCAADLGSYYREMNHGGQESSIVDVLRRERGSSPHQALTETVRLHDRTMCLFLNLSEKVTRHAGPELRRYVTQLSNLVSGNLEWGFTSPRYTAEYPLKPAVSGYQRADRPFDGRLDALPYPAISWWWEQL